MLIGKNFDQIDESTLRSLIEAGATESTYLEFKRDSYGSTDANKKEFLKDITSFANCLGGHLLIGIDEEDGAASALTPLTIGIDPELCRLEDIARTGIEPTIVGLRMKPVKTDGGCVIAIHVPRSFNPPHRVIHKNTNRYYSRSSSGVYELSLEELRLLFGQQRNTEERAKAFVDERFLRIQSNDGAMPISAAACILVMHLVPLPDFSAGRRIGIGALEDQQKCFRPIDTRGFSSRINLDGYNFYDGCDGYTQIFRNGSVEATTTRMFTDPNGGRSIPSEALPRTLIESLTQYLRGLRALEASPPILLQISMSGVQGIRMVVNRKQVSREPPAYDREVLSLPHATIMDYRDDENYESVVAEQMKFLWNAFGFRTSFYFDEDGNRIRE